MPENDDAQNKGITEPISISELFDKLPDTEQLSPAQKLAQKMRTAKRIKEDKQAGEELGRLYDSAEPPPKLTREEQEYALNNSSCTFRRWLLARHSRIFQNGMVIDERKYQEGNKTKRNRTSEKKDRPLFVEKRAYYDIIKDAEEPGSVTLQILDNLFAEHDRIMDRRSKTPPGSGLKVDVGTGLDNLSLTEWSVPELSDDEQTGSAHKE